MTVVARLVQTTYKSGQELLEAVADALAVARVSAPEAPVQFHAVTEDGKHWELTVLRHPIPASE